VHRTPAHASMTMFSVAITPAWNPTRAQFHGRFTRGPILQFLFALSRRVEPARRFGRRHLVPRPPRSRTRLPRHKETLVPYQCLFLDDVRRAVQATLRAGAAAYRSRNTLQFSWNSLVVLGMETRARVMYEVRFLPSTMSCMPSAAC
jgi:hypothetical protein